jgi:hypothetical protein
MRLAERHLGDNATMPLPVSERRRLGAHRLLLRSCRRAVLFNDDCEAVRDELDKVRGLCVGMCLRWSVCRCLYGRRKSQDQGRLARKGH